MLRIKDITRTPIGIVFCIAVIFILIILGLIALRLDWKHLGFWYVPFLLGFAILQFDREEWKLLFLLFQMRSEKVTSSTICKTLYAGDEKRLSILKPLADLGLVEISNDIVKLSVGVENLLSGLHGDISNVTALCEKQNAKAMICQPIFGANFEALRTNGKKLCFVLMPFAQELRPVFDLQIKPTVEKLDYSCMRADDFWGPHEIMKDVYENILRASFIIADLTRRNPNVFYEIGLAHLIGKPTILIAQVEEDVPFDLRPHRYFKYEWTPEKMNELGLQLQKSIRSMQDEGLIQRPDIETTA